jgi:hypothetical protein
MRFQVPQFIEVEDKLFLNLTIKQFIYVVGGLGMAFAIYTFVTKFLAFILIPIVLALAAALAFFPRERFGKPFVDMLEAAVKYAFNTKLYIWRKVDRKITPTEKTEKSPSSGVFIPRLSDSKLTDLTWSLDINEIMNPGAREMQGNKKSRV